jgi:hypothetical protein
MLDLETLSTSSRAAILQAGWVVFDPDATAEVSLRREVNVDVDSCLRLGGEVSDGTIRWWLSDRTSAAAKMSVSAPGVSVESMLTALTVDYQQFNCKAVWSHGATFDIPILQHYYERVSTHAETPWKFWDARDTRTLQALAARLGFTKPKGETAHSALADALAQAYDTQAAWRWITERGKSMTGVSDPGLLGRV